MSFDHYRNDAGRHAQDVAESLQRLNGAQSAGQYADAMRDKAVAAIEAHDWGVWCNAGWCGRLDLVHKLAANW